jgi:hypothetical protein
MVCVVRRETRARAVVSLPVPGKALMYINGAGVLSEVLEGDMFGRVGEKGRYGVWGMDVCGRLEYVTNLL